MNNASDMCQEIDWADLETSKEDRELIDQCVARVREAMTGVDLLELSMDLTLCHAKNPLRLKDMLESDDFNFYHDLGGIQRHLNRQTGQLEGFFSPRFSA